MREKCVVTNRGVFFESSSMAKSAAKLVEPVVEGSERDILIKTKITDICERCDPADFFIEMKKLINELNFEIGLYVWENRLPILCEYINKNNDAIKQIIINQ